MAAGKGCDLVSAGLEYLRDGRSEMDRNQEGQSNGYVITSLKTVPCDIAGTEIVLLEEKIVSNSLILQDMLMKDFIYIALACK